MPIQPLCDRDSLLFLWATAPLLPTALSVVEAWGFEFKTVAFTWIKTTSGGNLSWGMGHYTRSNAEFCLLGVRGSPKVMSHGVHSVVMSPRREHSRKPDEIRDLIIKLAGDVNRLELFARQPADGWDYWGNEVDGVNLDLIENI